MESFYNRVRKRTIQLCEPLKTEDYIIQAMPDVSPPKWHLAHTTWFFEKFILSKYLPDYRVFHPQYNYLFNSYYYTFGNMFTRSQRGLLSRPNVSEIYDYRRHVDEHILSLLNKKNDNQNEIQNLLTLGLHHEMQHQELLLMDVKYNFGINPLFPRYSDKLNSINEKQTNATPLKFITLEGGLFNIGHNKAEFCYDNELPHHQFYLRPFQVANRLITNGEYLKFINEKGYEKHQFWLSDGWNWLNQTKTQSPLYWHYIDGSWYEMTLNGLQELALDQPVCHVNYYEADAFASWAKKRLLTEFEWECAAKTFSKNSDNENFLDQYYFQPISLKDKQSTAIQQLFGDVWEWTSSAYLPYPGYRCQVGALGEYNAKFMSSQMVLRGGCALTPKEHMRASYRNFFYPQQRWQMCGIRLADDIN